MRSHGLGLLLAIASIAADEEALTLTEANFDSEVDRSHVFVKFYVRPLHGPFASRPSYMYLLTRREFNPFLHRRHGAGTAKSSRRCGTS